MSRVGGAQAGQGASSPVVSTSGHLIPYDEETSKWPVRDKTTAVGCFRSWCFNKPAMSDVLRIGALSKAAMADVFFCGAFSKSAMSPVVL